MTDFTYDPDTSRGRVRLLIADTDVAVAANQLFTDAEIDTFLAMEEDVKLAAARALKVMAANQVMVLKVIHLLDLKTDGASVSRELRALAAELTAEADEGDLEFAEWVTNADTYTERLRGQLLRGA